MRPPCAGRSTSSASLGFSNVRSQDVLVPRWVRGNAEVTLAGSAPQPLVAVALGGSIGTSDEGVEAQVVEVASLDALNALPAATVGGKIVFINERMERTRDGSGYGATVKNRSRRSERRRQSRRGRVADPLGRHFRSSATRTRARSAIASMRRASRRSLCRIPTRISWRAGSSRASRYAASEVDARELPATWSANVIGEIPGSRARQRDRAARRASRLVGSRPRRDR